MAPKTSVVKDLTIFVADLRRVQVSQDESLIYTGKDQLRVLQLDGGLYRLLEDTPVVNPFFDIKLLNNGDLIVFDKQTSDLVKYDQNLNQTQRLVGQKTIRLGKLKISIF